MPRVRLTKYQIRQELGLAFSCGTVLGLTRLIEIPFEAYYIGFVAGFWATAGLVLLSPGSWFKEDQVNERPE